MRNNTFRNFAAVAVLLCAASLAHAADTMKWAASYSAAAANAKSTNRLIMVDFYTDWCHWCKVLDSDTYTDSKVIALSSQLVPVKVNAEKEGVAQAKKYNITGYPTIMFLNADGTVAGKIVGYEAGPAFAKSMAQIITAHKQIPVLEASLAKKPTDSATALALMPLYASKGDISKTAAMLKIVEVNAPGSPELPAAYNALGDAYQNANNFDAAIPTFQKAVAAGKTPKDVAYAHISIAVCYLSQNKLKEAVPELEAVIATPDAPADLLKQAKDYLPKVKAAIEK